MSTKTDDGDLPYPEYEKINDILFIVTFSLLGLFLLIQVIIYILNRIKKLIEKNKKKRKIKIILKKSYKYEELLEENIKEEKCVICYDDYSNINIITILSCNHKYHKECIKKWIKIKLECPLCKNNLLEN